MTAAQRAAEMTRAEHIEEAATARSDLNTLYGVIALLEGGTVSHHHDTNVSRIIHICKSDAARALARYDKHYAAALSAPKGEE